MHHAQQPGDETSEKARSVEGLPKSSPIPSRGRSGRILDGLLEATRLRRGVQLVVFLLVLVIGVQFSLFVASCMERAGTAVSRPPGVGGFLPIAGLMGLRHWLSTGKLDSVQPSAAVLLLLAVLVSVVLKKSFCSWICPVGTLSEALWRLRARAFPRWPGHGLPMWLDALLMAPKYLLLGFFTYFIFSMPLRSLAEFIHGPYNRVADVRMLAFFEHPSLVTLAVLGFLFALSFLVQNAWCRYLCPYGALLGLASLVSPTKVRRLESACTGCTSCSRVCPMHLKVHEVGAVRSPECTGCMLCLDACPEDMALTMGPLRRWPRRRLAVLALVMVLAVYFGGIGVAKATGNWRNDISRREYRRIVPPAMQRYPPRGDQRP
jgi:polyferredoxin